MAIRILFIGDTSPYLTTAARRDAFLELGYPLEAVDQRAVRSGSRLLDLLAITTLRTPRVFSFNRAVLEAARRFRPDLVWIEKGTFVFPSTLRALRRQGPMALVYHNTDDWKARTRFKSLHWRYLLRSLPEYDAHITSNRHNVEEFRALGFPHVHHMELAANPTIQHPEEISDERRRSLGAPVGFIGHWEPETERMLLHLVRNGIELKIYGGGWGDARHRDELREAVQDRLVWGPEYAEAILSFEVNLGIVSTWNRNDTASRSFQIPALGAFLLHQRNELMTRYFREGQEAAFFGSDDELLEKCLHYLDHPEERRRVAEAGRRRCVESGYFEVDRVRELVPLLEEVVRARRAGASA